MPSDLSPGPGTRPVHPVTRRGDTGSRPGQDSPAGDVRGMIRVMPQRTRRLPLTVLFLLPAAYWALLWRTPVWSHDDLGFANRSRRHLGGLVPGDWPRQAWDDLQHRNGRLADMVVQVIMGARGWIGPLMALLCLAQVVAAWFLLREVRASVEPASERDGSPRPAGGPAKDILLIALASALPMAPLALDHQLAGDTVMFLSACVGYVGGSALLMFGLGLLLRATRRGGGKDAIGGAVLCVVAGLHHELAAAMAVGGCAALACTLHRARPVLWASLAATAVLDTARFAAGGLWHRVGAVGTPFPHPPLATVARLRAYLGHSITCSLAFHPWSWVLACAVLVALFVALGVARCSLRCAAAVLVTLADLALGHWATRPLHGNPRADAALAASTSTSATLAVLLTLALVALAVEAVLRRRRQVVAAPLALLTGGALGACAVPALLGTWGGRTSYYASFALTLAASCCVVVLACDLTGTRRPGTRPDRVRSLVAGVLAAALLVPATVAAVPMLVQVRRNERAWHGVLTQIDQVRRGQRDHVVVPLPLPAPEYSQDYIGLHRATLGPRLMFYYDLPETTPVTVAPAR